VFSTRSQAESASSSVSETAVAAQRVREVFMAGSLLLRSL
jgi:hypothetical protein